MHFREHFRERVRGSNFAVRVLCAFLNFRGQTLNTYVFLETFRALPGYPSQNLGIFRQNVWFSWVSRDIPSFLGPTRSRGKAPTPPEDIWTQKFGFVLQDASVLPDETWQGPKDVCHIAAPRLKLPLLFWLVTVLGSYGDSPSRFFEHLSVFLGAPRNLVAFHPQPQIASDLGRNVTRSFNPHRNRSQFPSGNKILAYGRRFKSQPASTRCDFENRKANPPLVTGDLNSSNRKPAGPQSQN